MGFKYTPDEDIKVHEEGAIKLICGPFRSHENGLPEWIKNASDAYAREDAPENKRVILIILCDKHPTGKPSISCLDFAGMTSADIEGNFRRWADPEAAVRGGKSKTKVMVQGGHGNGGKCYMTQMFDEYAEVYTVRGGYGNRYGVKSGSVKFGYIPDPERGRDFRITGLDVELEKALKPIKIKVEMMPPEALRALKLAEGFTLLTGVGPKEIGRRIPANKFAENLREHAQMIRTLGFCRVFLVVNGELFRDGGLLRLPEIEPLKGGEEPKEVIIPEVLKDPKTGDQISTTNGGKFAEGKLTLRTSDKSMRWKLKGRHIIIFKASSGYIGNIPVLGLDVQSSFQDRIYGECALDTLEEYKRNDRSRLVESRLTRAVEKWISDEVQKFARGFEIRELRRYDQAEKEAITRMNDALDQWKNRFLNKLMQGLWGPGEGIGDTEAVRLPGGKPGKIQVSLTHNKAGLGVSFRPVIKFFDEADRRIKQVPYKWVSEDNNVAMVDEEEMVVNTFAPGETRIYAESLYGKIRSNAVSLEVVLLRKVRIIPDVTELPAGSRQSLQAVCTLPEGEETSGVYLIWTEGNPEIARVSSSGLIFGFFPGETEVIAGDNRCISEQPAVIKVVESTGRGAGDKRGRGYPRVLVSEVNNDPDTDESVVFSSEYPPVWQRPKDVEANIWWINSAAPLASMYLDKRLDYGYKSREWRMYQLERYIDILVQIAMTHGPEEKETLAAPEWILKWGSCVAGIQEAAVSDLKTFIENGELP